MDQEQMDLEFARSLHLQLNGGEGDFVNLLDSDEEELVLPTASKKVKEEVVFENQQAITIKRNKSSPNEFFLPSMGTYIDLSTSAEWAEVNMNSNLQQMFDKLRQSYFLPWVSLAIYNVKWDTNCCISDGSSFKIFKPQNEILVATTGLIRPRIQLISLLLHVILHLYLVDSLKGTQKINIHDDNFREIMLFFNRTLSTSISTTHKFPYSDDEAEFNQQWYQCTGICVNYEPFHGVIRCSSNPSAAHSFWSKHEENCGGQFFKIFEMSRTNEETQEEENKYVRNVRYMFPKALSDGNNFKGRSKTKIQPRALYDLTDDADDGAAVVHNLCDVVNLDDTDYNLEASNPTSKQTDVVKKITNQRLSVFEKCPFCEIVIGASRFESHIDTCRGYQQKVSFNLHRALSKF